MNIINEFNKVINSNNRKFKIDKIYGADIFNKVIYPLLEHYDFKGVTIMPTGREQERILKKNDIDYKKPFDYYKIVDKNNDGSYKFELKKDFETSDLFIVWLSNFMEVPYINMLRSELGASLLSIGDSFLVDYFSDGNVINFIQNCDLVMDKIDNINDYSQELVYFINRIRNGEVEKLTNMSNRSYEVTNQKPELEELFKYDIVVTSSYYVGQTNRYIREMIFKTYDLEPIQGDKMIAYEPIQLKDKESEWISISFGEELTVIKKEITSNGHLILTVMNNEDKELRIWVDYKWLATRYGEDGDGYPKGGYKLFYSYVVPPEAMVDNSYESVFFEIKAGSVNNKRVLYSVGSSARQKLKIVYSNKMSYLY